MIDKSKYIALAYRSPQGEVLHQLVKDNWQQWVNQVKVTFWKSYKRAGYVAGVEELAEAVFIEAIWSLGIEGNWISDRQLSAKIFFPHARLGTRTVRGIGGTPWEFVLLDGWLQQLCLTL